MIDFFRFPIMLIFFHNATNGVRFNDFEEAKRCNKQDKYSALYKISPSHRINGKYEFLLDYESGFVHWRQSNNPLHETEHGTEAVEGYHLINFSVKNNAGFGGLSLTNLSSSYKANGCHSTLLNGIQKDANWWYSVGAIHSCETRWNNSVIPGAHEEVKYVKLWIRIRELALRICKERSVFTSIFIVLLLS